MEAFCKTSQQNQLERLYLDPEQHGKLLGSIQEAIRFHRNFYGLGEQ